MLDQCPGESAEDHDNWSMLFISYIVDKLKDYAMLMMNNQKFACYTINTKRKNIMAIWICTVQLRY